MIRNFKRLSISTMGITLIETAMIMMIVCLIVVGFSTLFSNQVENQGQEFATVTPAREPAYSTAASLKRLKENGPTEYQLELLRKANEEHAKRESDASTKITTAAKAPTKSPTPKAVLPTEKPVRTAQVPAARSTPKPASTVTKNTSGTWETTIAGSEAQLSLKTGSSYATIHWGDGSSENVYAQGSFQGSHRYSSEGPHTIRIEGADFKVLNTPSSPGV